MNICGGKAACHCPLLFNEYTGSDKPYPYNSHVSVIFNCEPQ